jgi:toxin ParE1/3/4
MSLGYSFHAMAEREMNETASFYENKRAGLGAAFLAEIERTVRRVIELPESAPLLNRLVRRMPLHRFPFTVFYSIKPDQIRILAIAHQKRRPFYWHGRH